MVDNTRFEIGLIASCSASLGLQHGGDLRLFLSVHAATPKLVKPVMKRRHARR
jgi:hypothetical protein